MQNWKRWRLTGGSVLPERSVTSRIYELGGHGRRDGYLSVLLVGEAQDTDRAVRALRTELRRAVEVNWLEHGTMPEKARMCACRVQKLRVLLQEARGAILANLAARARNHLKARPAREIP